MRGRKHYTTLRPLNARAQPKSCPQYLNIESNQPCSLFLPKFSLRNLDNYNVFSTVDVEIFNLLYIDSVGFSLSGRLQTCKN